MEVFAVGLKENTNAGYAFNTVPRKSPVTMFFFSLTFHL